ncbi:hypothetical protein Tco_0481413 [Tanacetum coccineum]
MSRLFDIHITHRTIGAQMRAQVMLPNPRIPVTWSRESTWQQLCSKSVVINSKYNILSLRLACLIATEVIYGCNQVSGLGFPLGGLAKLPAQRVIHNNGIVVNAVKKRWGDGSNSSLEWENNNLPRDLAAVCAQLDCPEKEADASSASEYGFPDLALIADSLILYILNQLFCTDFGTPKNPRITSLDNSAFATTFFVITLFFSSMLNAGIRAISCMIYKSQQIHAFLVYKTYSRGCIPLPV